MTNKEYIAKYDCLQNNTQFHKDAADFFGTDKYPQFSVTAASMLFIDAMADIPDTVKRLKAKGEDPNFTEIFTVCKRNIDHIVGSCILKKQTPSKFDCKKIRVYYVRRICGIIGNTEGKNFNLTE